MEWVDIAKCALVTLALLMAAFLAYHEKAGWGWMIFIAFCAIP